MRLLFILICTISLTGCAHQNSVAPETNSVPSVNLHVYRIEIGHKSSPDPVATLFMPKKEFGKFLATKEFRDREFRQNTFHNGCYLFHYFERESSRLPASDSDPIFCYSSTYDKFLPKSEMLR